MKKDPIFILFFIIFLNLIFGNTLISQIILSYLFIPVILYASLFKKETDGLIFAFYSIVCCLIISIVKKNFSLNVLPYFILEVFFFLILGYIPILFKKREENLLLKYDTIFIPKKNEYSCLEEKKQQVEKQNTEILQKIYNFESLYQVTKSINTTLNMNNIIILIKDSLSKILEFPNWYFFIVNKEEQKIQLSFSINVDEKIFEQTEFSIGEMDFINYLYKQKEKTFDLNIKEKTKCLDIVINDNIFSFYVIPYLSKNEVIGFLCNFNFDKSFLEKEKIKEAEILSAQLSIGIEKTILYEKIKKMSITDSVTNLYNYRHFQKLLEEELNRVKRYKKPLSFLLMDLDNFKKINDTYGHLIGDKMLIEVGKIILHNIRKVDIAARYGGEEFVIILPETTKIEAKEIAEKIRKNIENYKFKFDNNLISITISIGLASYPENSVDKEKLISEADYAVYQAKAKGKNCIVTFEKQFNT